MARPGVAVVPAANSSGSNPEGYVGHPEWLPAAALRSIMRPGHPVTTDPEADLAEVARRMLDNKARCMPVLEDGRVTGIVRLNDVLQHLAR